MLRAHRTKAFSYLFVPLLCINGGCPSNDVIACSLPDSAKWDITTGVLADPQNIQYRKHELDSVDDIN